MSSAVLKWVRPLESMTLARNTFIAQVSCSCEQIGDAFLNGIREYSSSRNKVQRLSRLRERSESRKKGIQLAEQSVQPTDPNKTESSAISVVKRSSLIVTRDIEWAQVMLGYEQANRYQVLDENGDKVALLMEQDGFGRALTRQLLRTRRGFQATVLSPDGQQVYFRLKRPPYLISSTLYIEDENEQVIGEVQQRWHLWRRQYELFIGRKQFARIDGEFLAWQFFVEDEAKRPLALIDRNFSGFGKEIFTDAGKYAIHFGESPKEAARHVQNSLVTAHPGEKLPPVMPIKLPKSSDYSVIPCTNGDQLVIKQSLGIDERMITLAAAISIDYDYFSRHSYGSGWLAPFVHPPIPMPMPIPSDTAGADISDDAHSREQSSQDDDTPSWISEEEEFANDDDFADGDEDGGSIFDLFQWEDE